MKKLHFLILVLITTMLLGSTADLFADAGVIVPTNRGNKPDPSILSLRQMTVSIKIDNQYARVKVLQIFKNHYNSDLEGKYIFTLPEGAQVSDFAIWEDGVRIPGVIVERKRARRIYEELTSMKIDPGLMETTSLDNRNTFSVEIYPIPAYGTKRVEIEYSQEIRVDSLRSNFNFPLKPNLYGKQSCEIFDITLDIESKFSMKNFELVNSSIPMEFSEKTAESVKGDYSGRAVDFREDFSFEYQIDASSNKFNLMTFRDDSVKADLGPFSDGKDKQDKFGYFEASAVYNLMGDSSEERPAKDIIFLVDTSLSMQWDKLEQSFQALEYFLNKMPQKDRFALVTFNSVVSPFANELLPATPAKIEEALTFFKNGYLTGGTNIVSALEQSLSLYEKGKRESYLILITDGAPTLDDLKYASIARRVKAANKAGHKLMIFGIGNSTNVSLLSTLAQESGGHFIWVSDTEDIDFKLTTFLDKLGEKVIFGLEMFFDHPGIFSKVYSSNNGSAYDRTKITYIGRYNQPGSLEKIGLSGKFARKKISLSRKIKLPEKDLKHPFLPRRWAKLRVDYLLTQIELSEDPEAVEVMIDEIIMLAKKYKFVTPYTSFLAAPRSLLRPRAIKPGDPVLRVKTIPSIESVVADFPFGLTKPLHYIADEDVWEVRFLAPKEMKDGTYHCTLLLGDKQGNLYSEDKSFIIDSKPPTLRVETDKQSYLPGDEVAFEIFADADTRRIQIKLSDLPTAEARYDADVAASTARMVIPLRMKPGKYTMKVTAVDFARNTTVLEVPIQIARR